MTSERAEKPTITASVQMIGVWEPPPEDDRALVDVSTLHERLLARIAHFDPYGLTYMGKAVRAVVELHAPSPVEYERRLGCQGCESDGDFGPQDWPCATIKIIAASVGRHLGLDVGEHSNLNDPWMRALDALAEAGGAKFVKGAYDDGVAEGRRQATEERTEEIIRFDVSLNSPEYRTQLLKMIRTGQIVLPEMPHG